MKQQSFKEWMANGGDDKFEEVMDWLEDCPSSINLRDLLGMDNDEYSYSICEEEWEGEWEDYCDSKYDELRDERMEGDDE